RPPMRPQASCGLAARRPQLSGLLPAELARVEHLRHLDLSGNGLNGTLPIALLLNATELRVLSLAGNDLSGRAPGRVLRAGAPGAQPLRQSRAGSPPRSSGHPGSPCWASPTTTSSRELPAVGHEDEVFVEMPKRDMGEQEDRH
uniref:Leucine-rich repeat-containing N-terminal plant-type domain-containing protein n=1 Tax=Aegilops tauschii subsp. strangulata TaxID=200361 RepID=A0A453DYM9_AEGTS